MHATIAAISTPIGRGGVGIVRLSGTIAYDIAKKIINNKGLEPRLVNHREFYNDKNELIDDGIVLYFKSPNSFTGEDVVELQGHGSPLALDAILQTCIALGARIAHPGEFSERAYLNNKIDLVQAEAIADLINSTSQVAARMAMRSLQGNFSKKINGINVKVINLRLYVEAAIDFPEEEIDFLSDGRVQALYVDILTELDDIYRDAYQGSILRDGLSIVIAGRPNAGKSTLINYLAQRDVAIVSHVAGTTRDVMREHVMLDDLSLCLIDTAGLCESTDPIEQEGIRRAWHELSQADCVLMLIDVCDLRDDYKLDEQIRTQLPINTPIITIYNKIDCLVQGGSRNHDAIYLSAKSGEGVALLKEKIKIAVGYQSAEGQFLARRRHVEALAAARVLMLAGLDQLSLHGALELLAEDLRLTHRLLGEITGEFSSDDLLGEIFSSFCIGK